MDQHDRLVPILIALGSAIRKKRQQMGISQEDLAQKCGLHRTYIGGIERGERNLSFQNLHIIATELNTTISELSKEI